MDDCQRCGQRLHWNAGHTTLIGNCNALLCLACRNAWHAYFLTLPASSSRSTLDAHFDWLQGRAIAQDPPALEEWTAWRTASETWHVEMFTIGQLWLATPVALA